MSRTNEAAFETVIEYHLLQNGYVPVAREGFDREPRSSTPHLARFSARQSCW
ncbi:MAG: hypothetical protein HY675_15540 [Chloroflexi bacterium]|nr:hypothetical protein [Chloroflexota bacterium]